MAKGNQGKSKAAKTKSKAKGNDDTEHDNGRCVYLIKVNVVKKTATITELPTCEKNSQNEVYVIVPRHIVKTLAAEAYDGTSGLIKHIVAQNIRAQVNDAPELDGVTINLDVDKMAPKTAGPKEKPEPVEVPEPTPDTGTPVDEELVGTSPEPPFTPQEPNY